MQSSGALDGRHSQQPKPPNAAGTLGALRWPARRYSLGCSVASLLRTTFLTLLDVAQRPQRLELFRRQPPHRRLA